MEVHWCDQSIGFRGSRGGIVVQSVIKETIQGFTGHVKKEFSLS